MPLRALADAPSPLLERLAAVSGVSLSQLGLAPPGMASAAFPASPDTPGAVGGSTAQSIVDDALREEAEVSPRLLRPALSRMLDRMARAGVPMDAAARMVLGVPKKEPKAATRPSPPR